MDGAALGDAWDRLLFQMAALSGEYLFFIGASLLAALLLKHRRWLAASACFALALLWLSFHLPVSLYLESLGADSFAETRGFDLDEAQFWAQTLKEAIEPDFSLKKFAAYLAAATLAFYALRWLFHRRGWTGRLYLGSKLALSLGLIGLAFHQTTAKALAFYLENTEKFHATVANFAHPAPPLLWQERPVDLVVYIGESTSVMNMGLYGYSRATTPELSALAASDPALLVFDHVFATHAHTSRSLLEAFSLGLDPREAFLPITERQRLSLVDLLIQGGLSPRLISNQGLGGSWDQASSVIFRRSHNIFSSRAEPSQGGNGTERAWDHAFFAEQLRQLPAPNGPSQVLFLHSYSGHGPYLKNIPERFRQPVDDKLTRLPRPLILRDPSPPLDQIEAYDAAVRYVDFSVSQAIAQVRQATRPTVLVYFSDHGDAVYAGIGHDSARFRHEMARVPFLLYVNAAAQQARPALLPKYRQLAQAGRTATLAQLPSTLLDLLGARPKPGAGGPLLTPVIGEPVRPPPIMVRRTAEGIGFVNLSGETAPTRSPHGDPLWDRTDADTRRYLAARQDPSRVRTECTNAQTLEEVSRNTMVLLCPAPSLLLARQVP
jgi:hypothetical protein